ncbi:DNA polymerase III subunit gamma and tau [Curtobacterium sp. ZW137]|uniref:DNA polymerase III subunit gamma and tau n=1 Tax=Curtobacterium sp. ZW137 TaxID=2485104 RepID=UPI000F4BDAA4|nr:DNA polymerase III subunit gamma and tau [Curtobacterium sp. ZW137]ROP60292.1 DNA polymerase-3 subunit gamma/tau [Curtobacterium sp. ZW137]
MVTALYRRYRPENFAELIGQSQVTDPLRTALRTNRVNHAYLFSGPRGCGKTTSARILARCLNCAEGPTDTPCGVCPSCVELARGGSGSLDVIEIDAASHNGVDDARDLRDRAVFAPARDRYKIFILDEAHMVTPQGFNALLKLVEEPPEHVKFIFATTEPEKVIGTIRSRTHHYPFRLVPPAVMLEYVEQLCGQESVSVAPGVLPLVVRAGGGSVRDTLSLLDQLIAGSEDGAIAYDRAVALLGYTDSALLDDVVDALAVADPGSAFAAIDRVVQTGQDPRRFVEDLLERLRDLIVVAATNESAGAVLRGVSPEELDTMTRQAGVFGANGLSRGADIANRALTDMTGATSPRLHLELMIARMLVPEADDTQRGALARVERLERRVGVGDAGGHHETAPSRPVESTQSARTAPAAQAPSPIAATAPRTPAQTTSAQVPAAQAPVTPAPTVNAPATNAPVTNAPATNAPTKNAAQDAAASWAAVAPSAPEAPESPERQQPAPERTTSEPSEHAAASSTGQGTVIGSEPVVQPIAAVGLQQMRDTWPQVLEHVQRAKRSAWTVVVTAQVTALRDDVLTLTFPSQQDVASFKEMSDPTTSVSELVRAAIQDLLGFRVKFVARGPGGPGGAGQQRPAVPQNDAPSQPAPQQAAPTTTAPTTTAPSQDAPVTAAPDQAAPTPTPAAADQAPPRQSTAPEDAPKQDAPKQDAPKQDAPKQDVPKQDAPKQDVPKQPAPSQAAPQEDPAPQQDRAPAPEAPAPAPSTSSGPVTEWAVATIPATDPTAGAVPDDVEPTWAAPMGSTAPGDTVAPAGAPAQTPVPTSGPVADVQAAIDALQAGKRPAQVAPPARDEPPVPVDDYPLDDAPFDDGAPFPDPGPGGAPAPTQPAQQQPAQQQQQPAERQQQQQPARQQPPAQQQQVRRAPVPGRYGEAVVREILGAQFIEETSLSEGS